MKHYDIAIIGAGPAGMAAGIYAKRAGKSAAIFEGLFHGGQAATTYEIENYIGTPAISGPDLMNKFYEHAAKFDVEFIYEEVHEVTKNEKRKTKNDSRIATQFDIRTVSGEYSASRIIIATGARALELGLESEKKLKGRGISYCATCDGSFFRGKKVAVVGGGNTAVEDALYLADLCEKVYIIHRRDELRADKILADRLLANPKITPIWNAVVEEFIGDDKLEKVVLRDVGAVVPDRPRATEDGRPYSEISIDGCFIAIGNKPNSEMFADLVKLDSGGYILTNEKMQTNVDGIYAAGDVRATPLRQIITAAADGAIAATYACRE